MATNYEQTISEKIKQRRMQMLVHSYIYYELDQNIISDAKWSQWAMELVELQKKYPVESKSTEFYNEFIGWDGSSGAFLKIPERIKTVALHLLDASVKKKESKPISKKTKSKTGARKLF